MEQSILVNELSKKEMNENYFVALDHCGNFILFRLFVINNCLLTLAAIFVFVYLFVYMDVTGITNNEPVPPF